MFCLQIKPRITQWKCFTVLNVSFSKDLNSSNTFNLNPCENIKKVNSDDKIELKYELHLFHNDVTTYFHAKALYNAR